VTQMIVYIGRIMVYSPPRPFAPWLIRPLADSPTRTVVSLRYDDRNSYAYNLQFILFQGFLFRLRLYKERQLYNSIIKASIFRQIRKPKSIFYYLHSMCNRKYTFPPRS